MKVSFYLVETIENFLPKLLEKIYSQKKNIVVVCQNQTHLSMIDTILWTRSSFLPHGSAMTFNDAVSQPIWLTEKWENPNHATIAVSLNETVASIPFEHIIDITSLDPHARLAIYKEKRCEIHYWKQHQKGGWYDSLADVHSTSSSS